VAISRENDPPPNGTSPVDPSPGTSGRRATILDVARAADVSVSAVSKVVRNAYGVSPQMRERVTAAIESLGYRPNAGARSMRGRSYTIGVVVTEFGTPFQLEVAQAIADELEPTPFHVVVVAGGDTPERQKPQIEGLIDRQVDGLILVAPWLDAGSIERIGQGLPIVTIALHGTPQHFDTVVDDEGLGARLVVDHLVALGHRRIVHTSQASGDWERDFILSHTARRLGFQQAMRSHDLEPDIIESYYSEEGGYAAAVQAFSRDPRPTAIFAGADIAALGVLRAAEEHRLRVPEDLTVVGYDNIYTSTINRVSLTTVDQSGRETGAASIRLLMERINGRSEPQQFVVAPQLVVRRTSGPPDAASVGPHVGLRSPHKL
jgi:LacI family transcriptional regulator